MALSSGVKPSGTVWYCSTLPLLTLAARVCSTSLALRGCTMTRPVSTCQAEGPTSLPGEGSLLDSTASAGTGPTSGISCTAGPSLVASGQPGISGQAGAGAAVSVSVSVTVTKAKRGPSDDGVPSSPYSSEVGASEATDSAGSGASLKAGKEGWALGRVQRLMFMILSLPAGLRPERPPFLLPRASHPYRHALR